MSASLPPVHDRAAPPAPATPANRLALPGLIVSDDALLALSAANSDLRLERDAQGALVVMPPTGSETGRLNLQLALALGTWAQIDGTGVCFDSSAGFRLPNSAVRSADAAWVRKERWAALTSAERSNFAPLCPDFVLELVSPNDNLAETQAKTDEFMSNGARLGWVIDPFERCVHVYRPGASPVALEHATEVDGDPVLPGFVLSLVGLVAHAHAVAIVRGA